MLNIGCEFEVEGRLYTVLELLGKGANAAAYLAQCQNGGLAAKCILKNIHPQTSRRATPLLLRARRALLRRAGRRTAYARSPRSVIRPRPSTAFLKRTAPLMSRSPAITALRSIS